MADIHDRVRHLVIDAMALILIVFGTVEAFFAGLRLMFAGRQRAMSSAKSGSVMDAGWSRA